MIPCRPTHSITTATTFRQKINQSQRSEEMDTVCPNKGYARRLDINGSIYTEYNIPVVVFSSYMYSKYLLYTSMCSLVVVYVIKLRSLLESGAATFAFPLPI